MVEKQCVNGSISVFSGLQWICFWFFKNKRRMNDDKVNVHVRKDRDEKIK